MVLAVLEEGGGVVGVVGVGGAGSADFEALVGGFEGGCGGLVEVVVEAGVGVPEGVDVGFVPEFPVADVVVVAVGPAVVVVSGDVEADVGPGGDVGGWLTQGCVAAGAFAEAVVDLGAGVDDGGDDVVAGVEVVVGGVGGVEGEVGEDGADVGGAEVVVGADAGDADGLVLCGEVCGGGFDGEGSVVDLAVGSYEAVGLGAVEGDGQGVGGWLDWGFGGRCECDGWSE